MALLAVACLAGPGPARAERLKTPLKHVIMIMQENRSFDNYFGTFPGADGIKLNTCLPLSLDKPWAASYCFTIRMTSTQAPPTALGRRAVPIWTMASRPTKMDGFVAGQGTGKVSCTRAPQSCADYERRRGAA